MGILLSIAALLAAAPAVSTVRVSDFGCDAEDSTRFIQAALDAGAETVVLDRKGSPWMTDSLFLRSNTRLVFEPGVELCARKGGLVDPRATLLSFLSVTNVTVSGAGGTVRLRREDYVKPPYRASQHRHAIACRGGVNVTVEGLTVVGAGGDGVYVCGDRTGNPTRNLTVRDVTVTNSCRQGMSVISVKGLLVDRVKLLGTRGSSPEAGIDFEPNFPTEYLQDIVVRDTLASGNAGNGFGFSLWRRTADRPPVTARFENCRVEGGACSVFYQSDSPNQSFPQGEISFKDCTFANAARAAVRLSQKPKRAVSFRFENCRAENCGGRRVPEILLYPGRRDDPPADGIDFGNFEIVRGAEQAGKRFFEAPTGDWMPEGVTDLTGRIALVEPSGTRTVALDEAWRKATFRPASVGATPMRVEPDVSNLDVQDVAPGAWREVTAMPVRFRSRWLVWAERPRRIRLRVAQTKVTVYKASQKPLRVTDPRGRKLGEFPLPDFGTPGEISFDAPVRGLYALAADVSGNTFAITASDAPVALDVGTEPMQLMGMRGTARFCANGEFALFTRGQGSVRLTDPQGVERAAYTGEYGWNRCLGKGAPGLFALSIDSRTLHLDLLGAQGHLFPDAGRSWTSARKAASVVALSSWRFARDGGSLRDVSVPHDWAIEGPFDPDAPGGTGKLPWTADGEYRTTFELNAKPGHARLEFDGVMARPEIFVNGTKVGGWDYGYMSFACDVTPVARVGRNEVVVKATTRPHRSRWHPGGGIYREVRLVTDAKDHVVPGSVFIRSTVAAKGGAATVTVDWTMSESGQKSKTFTVERPRLWSVEDPHLYALEVAGQVFRYGIRTARWTADDGFHLNGRRVPLKGVNLHSDLGPLGMAFDRDAAKRQLLLLKDMGVNAIRTAHNAPDPKFLDLCDEMGFLVWNECFDKWDETAGRDSAQSLEGFVVRNLEQFVRRDRNHPSVICWSISNEIARRGTKYGGPDGQDRARNRLFRDTIRALDPTRAVTAGLASQTLLEDDTLADLDVQGWNYARSYAAARAMYPKKPFVYSESASAVSSYGFYRLPPTRGKTDFPTDVRQVDGYDLTAAWCGDIPDVEFDRVDRDRYLAGEFVWTGIDYLGEPNPFVYIGRPDCWPGPAVPEREKPRSSYFGIADLCCVPKDRYYLYRSRWNATSETTHLVPHRWNWTRGMTIPVFVYTSGDRAELFLNGRSLGECKKADVPDYPLAFAGRNPVQGDFATSDYYRICRKYRLRWDVPYEPGELRVVASRGGARIGEDVVRTAGEPVRLTLAEDPFTPSDSALAFLHVGVADAAGVPVAASDLRFEIATSGDVAAAAVGNGDAMSFKSMKDVSHHFLFGGKAVLYVRRGSAGGGVSVSAKGLRPATFDVRPVSAALKKGDL